MSDELRTAVAEAIAEALPDMSYDEDMDQWYWPNKGSGTWPLAGAAIAAAEPHIRRKVIKGLIAEAERGDIFPFRYGDSDSDDLADWLRSHLEATQ